MNSRTSTNSFMKGLKQMFNTTVSDLTKAKMLIEQGWCQDSMTWVDDDGHKNYCSIGALSAASDNYKDLARMVKKVNRLDKHGGLINFNDSCDTTKEMVVAAFQKTIDYHKNPLKHFWYRITNFD